MKEKLLQTTEKYINELFSVACDIFDNPEEGGKEVFASELLTRILEENGFSAEREIAGLPTAFRATFEKGSGGPSIGFLLEYDALRGMGHACGHHMQGPAAIAAALALRDCVDGPFKLVLYGTPDEEICGGKIVMEREGCFRDVDVMFAYHAASVSGVSAGSRALASTIITFNGIPAHASACPEKGRSALDAMMLAFHGMEVMREHVREGSRIQYTVLEGTGATNIVHEKARARITLRSQDRTYLEELRSRMQNVIKGACLMTDTTASVEPLDVYWNIVPVKTLIDKVLSAQKELELEKCLEAPSVSGGSTDVGNVSWVVPTANIYTAFSDKPCHSEEFMNEGKSEGAKSSMLSAAKTFVTVGSDLIEDKALLEKIKEEHREAVK